VHQLVQRVGVGRDGAGRVAEQVLGPVRVGQHHRGVAQVDDEEHQAGVRRRHLHLRGDLARALPREHGVGDVAQDRQVDARLDAGHGTEVGHAALAVGPLQLDLALRMARGQEGLPGLRRLLGRHGDDVGDAEAAQGLGRSSQQGAGGRVGVEVGAVVVGQQDGLHGVLEQRRQPRLRGALGALGAAQCRHVSPACHHGAGQAARVQRPDVPLEDAAVEPLHLVQQARAGRGVQLLQAVQIGLRILQLRGDEAAHLGRVAPREQLGRKAPQPFEGLVHQHHAGLAVQHHQGVGRRCEQGAQEVLAVGGGDRWGAVGTASVMVAGRQASARAHCDRVQTAAAVRQLNRRSCESRRRRDRLPAARSAAPSGGAGGPAS
jgi:hypothetical protein